MVRVRRDRRELGGAELGGGLLETLAQIAERLLGERHRRVSFGKTLEPRDNRG